MSKINQNLETSVKIEAKRYEGKTYEELVEIAKQNNKARREEEALRREEEALENDEKPL